MKLGILIVCLALSFVTKSAEGACSCANEDTSQDAYGPYRCGGRLPGCDKDTLYYCPTKASPIKVAQKCTGNCQQSAQVEDQCSECGCSGIQRYKKGIGRKKIGAKEAKDGDKFLYCGSKLKCQPDKLFYCSNNEQNEVQTCATKCIEGTEEGGDGEGKSRCSSCKCSGPGTFCGDTIGCSSKYIKKCSGKDAIPERTQYCGSGCITTKGGKTFPPRCD